MPTNKEVVINGDIVLLQPLSHSLFVSAATAGDGVYDVLNCQLLSYFYCLVQALCPIVYAFIQIFACG
jgi:hypothetical protein